jgi:branched-chain amino acid transport system permease protein
MTGWLGDNLVTIINGVSFGVLLYLLAVGLSIMYGMLGVLNLAHGALYLAGGYVAVSVVGGDTSWTSMLLALGVAALVGGFGGAGLALMTRPVSRRGHMHEALLTLGVALAVTTLMTVFYGGEPRSVPIPDVLAGSVVLFGHDYPVYRLAVIVVGLLIAVGVEILLEHTSLGATVRAIVADGDMVRALGVDVRKVYVGVFSAGAVLAAVSGVLGSPILGVAPGVDGQVLLIALVVVVVGGLGSARGALLSAVPIGIVQNLGTALIPQLAPFLLFGAMTILLVLRPQGLVRGKALEA